jgi:hypothetical protein
MEEVRKTNQNIEPSGTSQELDNQNVTPQQPADIDKLIDEKLLQKQRREQVQANVQTVATELTKVWGPNFQTQLVQRANDLGLSQEFLGSVAERSPKAFLSLILTETKKTNPNVDVAPKTTISKSVIPGDGVRNKTYYDKLRKQVGNLSVEQRAQMHKDAQRLGEEFFN